jgi:hypothetical protein
MIVKNMTPHAVNMITKTRTVTFEPTGVIPRCTQSSEHLNDITVDGFTFPIVKSVFGEVFDLPEKEEDTIIIVSMVVAKARPDRDDLVFPNELVRDDSGVIIGCKSLARP